jgi:hypothetical protein
MTAPSLRHLGLAGERIMMKSTTPDSASRDDSRTDVARRGARIDRPSSDDPYVRATTGNVWRSYAEVVRDGPITHAEHPRSEQLDYADTTAAASIDRRPYGRPSSSPAVLDLGGRNVEEHASPSFDGMSETSERSYEDRESTSSETELPVYDSDDDEKTFLSQGASQAEYDRSSSRVDTSLDDYDYPFRVPSSLAASPEVSVGTGVKETPDNASNHVKDVETMREKLRGERAQSVRDTTGRVALTREELIRETTGSASTHGDARGIRECTRDRDEPTR